MVYITLISSPETEKDIVPTLQKCKLQHRELMRDPKNCGTKEITKVLCTVPMPPCFLEGDFINPFFWVSGIVPLQPLLERVT